MTVDALQLFGGVVGACWQLFTTWTLPGTNATAGEFALFLFTVYLTLRFFKRLGKVDDSKASDKN